jgi:uncharacterized protein YbaR (Trm112 family)
MPFTISCPHCRSPLTVHESAADQVVGCPYCRQPLTVPPPAQPEQLLVFDNSAARPRRRAVAQTNASVFTIALGVVLGGLLLAGIAGSVYWMAVVVPEHRREVEYSVLVDEHDAVANECIAAIKRMDSQELARVTDFGTNLDRLPSGKRVQEAELRVKACAEVFRDRHGRYPRYLLKSERW